MSFHGILNIVEKILSASTGEVSEEELTVKLRLDRGEVEKHLHLLRELGLIEEVNREGRVKYRVSGKGKVFLLEYRRFKNRRDCNA